MEASGRAEDKLAIVKDEPAYQSFRDEGYNENYYHLYFVKVKDKFVTILRNITVEPAVLMFTVAVALGGVTTQSLVMRKYCLVQMGQPDDVCRNLTENSALENEAQEFTTNFIMYKTMLDTLPCALWGLVIGSWSDKNGRKLLLMLPASGACIGAVMATLNAFFEVQWDVKIMLVSSIPVAFTGGLTSVVAGAVSYVADITNLEQRSMRFAIVQTMILCGLPIGIGIGGIILKNFGYISVFATSASLSFCCLIYVHLCVKETIKSSLDRKQKFFALFNISNLKDGLKTLSQKREYNGKLHLIFLTIAIGISYLPLYAEYNITYLYTRKKFHWNELTYSNYTTTVFIAAFLGLLVGMPIMSLRLKLRDVTIGVMSAVCKIISEIIIAVVTDGRMLFATLPFVFFNGLIGICVRSIMSKIVSASEQGKIASVLSAVESALPSIGAVTFSQLYNSTLDSFPGAIYILSASLALLPASVLVWIYTERKNIHAASVSKCDLVDGANIQENEERV